MGAPGLAWQVGDRVFPFCMDGRMFVRYMCGAGLSGTPGSGMRPPPARPALDDGALLALFLAPFPHLIFSNAASQQVIDVYFFVKHGEVSPL